MKFFKRILMIVLMFTALVGSVFGSTGAVCVASAYESAQPKIGHVFIRNGNMVPESAEFVFRFSEMDSGDMTVSYKLFNDSEEDETIRCFVPTQDGENTVVKVDGVQTETKSRFTLDYAKDSAANGYLLEDTYTKDLFFKPDLPVTKYSYRVLADAYAYSLKISAKFYGVNTMFFAENGEYRTMEGNKHVCYADLSKSEIITFYALGADFKEEPVLEIKKEFGENSAYSIEFLNKETMEFSELALSQRDEKVSETDWYNAVVANFKRCGDEIVFGNITDVKDSLVEWVEYYVDVKANGRVVNEISMPVKPLSDISYESYYGYVLDLTYAQAYANEGITVKVITPFELSGWQFGYDEQTQAYVAQPPREDVTVNFWIGQKEYHYIEEGFSDFGINFLARVIFTPVSFLLAHCICAKKRKS